MLCAATTRTHTRARAEKEKKGKKRKRESKTKKNSFLFRSVWLLSGVLLRLSSAMRSLAHTREWTHARAPARLAASLHARDGTHPVPVFAGLRLCAHPTTIPSMHASVCLAVFTVHTNKPAFVVSAGDVFC
eukprot:TRINITY_DN5346_c1_g3_i1.p3 TRINITY_DN5346_c1_g3~~TRINITY_DN5346_c1_g3_i1.p3  ORF type:complete len:146 (+),score=1.60 TRINITY_DN5346_c1_g3_i1:48-440(+)